MQKLSSTWKQQKQLRPRQEMLKSSKPATIVKMAEVGRPTTKRLGQHPVAIGAQSFKLIGQSKQASANQNAAESRGVQAVERSVPEKTFRRSPRLKGGQIEDNNPAISEQPADILTEKHHGCSFNSSFSTDLEDDVLQAIEEAEANFCHQAHSTKSRKATGSLPHGMPNAQGKTGDPNLNSEDLFTEIKPSSAREKVRIAPNISSSKKPAKKGGFSRDARLNPDQESQLELSRGTNRPLKDKCAKTNRAIMTERVANIDKTRCTLPDKLTRSLMDSSESSQKENLSAGHVYCLDSQSQDDPPKTKKSKQMRGSHRELDGPEKLILKDQRMKDGKRRACISVSNSVHARSPVTSSKKDVLPSSAMRGKTMPPSSPDPLLLSSWGLPEEVLAQYHQRHITQMFAWQAECLALGRVLEGGNLVYSAPTSAGKTLVAELLILKRVLETKKKALFILPFVSVAREKMFYLQSMFQEAGVSVGGYMGSESPRGGFQTVDVAVCTIEKANSLVNRLLEENKVDQIGIIVVDELHMVGDAHRGYLLELLLTKIRYISKRCQDAIKTSNTRRIPAQDVCIQIVGMSATLPNLDQLAQWLDADLYRTDFRPVPLTQTLKIGPVIYDASLTRLRDVQPSRVFAHDEDQVLALCLETLAIGCSVLIFCPTKNWCEKLAENTAREFARLMGGEQTSEKDGSFPINLNKDSLHDVIEQLKRTPVGLDPVLHRTVPYGVAYHHAGLSFDERDIIEGAFRQSALKILVATSTLSSGVNLPARRVIIRSVMFHRKVLDPLVYRQMSGRAGRKGVDSQGESILICKTNERDRAARLMQADLPPVQSCLKKPGQDLSNSMKRAILEVIASGTASSPNDVHHYANCTLLAACLPTHQGTPSISTAEDSNSTAASIQSCLTFLQTQEFVLLQKVRGKDETEEILRPTQLGSATLASALSPDEAIIVFTELQRARKNFVLENDLHLLYLVTPIYDQGFQPDWYEFMCTWENLSTDKRRVAELVGVEERFLIRASQGALSTHTAKLQHALAVHKRFYTTLILDDLVREMPVVAAARKYSCARGQLQSLQQSAATFAGMVTSFCNKLGWTNLELLLSQYQSRLTFGVQRELCDLVRISLLNAFRARLLFHYGFASVAAVAAANPGDIEGVLRRAVPFQSSRKAIGEQQYEVEERKKSRCIWATGRQGLTEQQAALMIIQEAKQLLQTDLGALGVAWKPTDQPQASNAARDGNAASSNIQPPVRSPSSQAGGDVKELSRIQPPKVTGSSRSSDDTRDVTPSTIKLLTPDAPDVSLTTRCRKDIRKEMSSSKKQPTHSEDVAVSSRSDENNPGPMSSSMSVLPPNGDCIPADAMQGEERTAGHPQRTERLEESPPQTRVLRSRSVKVKPNDAAEVRGRSESRPKPDGRQAKESHEGLGRPTTRSLREGLEINDTSEMKTTTNKNVRCSPLLDKPLKQVLEKLSGVSTSPESRTLTVTADVHIDASSSVQTSSQASNSSQKLETSTATIVPGISEKKSNIHSVCSSSHQMPTSACENTLTKSRADDGQQSASSRPISIQDLQTPKPSLPNLIREPEMSPDLFSVPVTPVEEANSTPKDPVTNTPATNQLPPSNLTSFSSAFSPLDSQMLQFLEQQENVYYLENRPTADPKVLHQQSSVAPGLDELSSKEDEFKNSPTITDHDPEDPEEEDPGLIEDNQDTGGMIAQQVLPRQDKHEVPISLTQSLHSSPSYSPLGSQSLLSNETSSELHLSPSQESNKQTQESPCDDLHFPSSFPTLDSQVLRIIDEFHTTSSELAATSASPSFKSRNKSRTSGRSSNAKSSRKSSCKKSVLKSRQCSARKKQRLVLTFCQDESPYSEFYQDDELSLDLAESLECSFVVDRTDSTMRETVRGESCLPDLRRQSSSTTSMRRSSRQSCRKAESPVYSQLEADMILAAEWSDFFSFDEGKEEAAVKSPQNSNPQEPKDILSESNENEDKIPEKQTARVRSPEAASSKDEAATGSVDIYFSDVLSPGTVAMLDAFAGGSESKISSHSTETNHCKDPQTPFQLTTIKTAKSTTKPPDANPTFGTKTLTLNPGKSQQQQQRTHPRRRQDLDLRSDAEKTSHQRKRRSSEAIGNLARENVSTKKSRPDQSQASSSPSEDGTPEPGRRSDDDLLSPTPPRTKPNTPKLLKGTPKQKPPRDIPAGEAETPRSLRPRDRAQEQPVKLKKTVREDARSTPKQRKRKSPRSIASGSQKQPVSSLNMPQCEKTQVEDLDTACNESQLHLCLDSNSSFEVEPPTPITHRVVSKKPTVSPRLVSSKDALLPASLRQQPSPKVSGTQGAFTVIDVCSSKELFETFLKEWRSKSRYSLSVACESYQPPRQEGGIGANFRKATPRSLKSDPMDLFQVPDEGLQIIGLSVCWEEKDAYFISLQKEIYNVDVNDSLAQPELDPLLSKQRRLHEVKATLDIQKSGSQTQDVSQLAFDVKEQYKVLSRGCGVLLSGQLMDPKVAHWLLDPGAKERNLQGLVTNYIPSEGHILEGLIGGAGLGSLGLLCQDPGTGRLRSATESVLVLALMDHLVPLLREDGLLKAFTEVEMPSALVLARMELTGFGFSQEECQAQRDVMQAKLTALEEEAYQMMGHAFSLTSPQDIAQVLYVELNLPPNGDPSQASSLRKTLGARGSKPRLPKHPSTSKECLERLRPLHPLPAVILEWRRITAAVTKVVYPLLKERKAAARLGGERIYASCQTHTATGRVCMSEPNIQAIPRDFEIQMPSTIGESPPMGASLAHGYPHSTRPKRRGTRMATDGPEGGPSCCVSVRHAFCPFQGGVLIAADYSQLELRILAHLSKDVKLVSILNAGGDVFKTIAAQWRQTDQVTPKQRQQAKQICYGMVYGIGAKALALQLEESEEDAAAFMESFKSQYKGIKRYIKDTIDGCRTSGYVQTILQRRRYLPAITHANPAARNQAERQAVNTTVQGSAADLVKVAMVNVDRRLREEFPDTVLTHRHEEGLHQASTNRRKPVPSSITPPSGAYLVLQLHDELIYEVQREDVIQVAQLVKMEMESAITLSVRLPVKVKVGPTWGSLQDYDV